MAKVWKRIDVQLEVPDDAVNGPQLEEVGVLLIRALEAGLAELGPGVRMVDAGAVANLHAGYLPPRLVRGGGHV